MLDLYGVEDPKGKYLKKLFYSVNSLEPNNFGLKFVVDKFSKVLQEKYFDKEQKIYCDLEYRTTISKVNEIRQDNCYINKFIKKKRWQLFSFSICRIYVRAFHENFSNFLIMGYNYGPFDFSQKGANVRDQGYIKISKNSKKDLFYDYQKFDLMD